MLTIDEIRKKKKEYRYTNLQLSMLSGVPLGTVQKVLGNVTKSPRYETLQALSAVFEGSTVHRKISYLDALSQSIADLEAGEDEEVIYVREPEPAYNVSRPALPNPVIAVNWNTYDRQGTYTLEDYLALPDDQRVELIDGVFYDMGSPSAKHQLIGGEVYRQIANYIRDKKGKCIPFIAPMDVQLDMDNRTIVEPDVLVVCDRSKINRNRVFGAPDFILEVLSPSTRNKDILIKSTKYMQAGVKEYWMVDPMRKSVMIYTYLKQGDMDIQLYTFKDKVPIAVYDGELVIDFSDIEDYISFID